MTTTPTLKQALEHFVQENNATLFYNIFHSYQDQSGLEDILVDYSDDEYEYIQVLVKHKIDNLKTFGQVVEDRYDGDGSDYSFTVLFPELDGIYITAFGYYSSWAEPEFSSLEFTQPYTHTETRYK
jgi:hypothetical protein